MDEYVALLNRFDPIGLQRYRITAADLKNIESYIRILQSGLPETVWDEAIQLGGAYGTSLLVHEIVEIRALQTAGIDPYQYPQAELARVLAKHLTAHVTAIYEEHLYLQDVLLRHYGCYFEVATLVNANRADDVDLTYFLESDIGVFMLEENRVTEARMHLTRLRQEKG